MPKKTKLTDRFTFRKAGGNWRLVLNGKLCPGCWVYEYPDDRHYGFIDFKQLDTNKPMSQYEAKKMVVEEYAKKYNIE